MLMKLPNYAWSEVGGSHHASILASSETPGEPKKTQLEKAMKAPIDIDKLRKAGM
jgi:hypothetical protein